MLELMIVLAIFALLIAVVTPKITVNAFSKSLYKQANTLRSQLQEIADQSIFTGEPLIVSKDQEGQWLLWAKQEKGWVQIDTLYAQQPETITDIKTNALEQQKVLKSLAFTRSALFVFLSNGRYLGFDITMTSNEETLTLQGDGINDLQIQ
ncbi:hypothetical protein [Marinomonas sp. THO17]|uniref:hypothetical protein n=1 Tax=Marinomonas sp. THO17 TaxID=3149048 RepID=UPI00336BBA0E